MKTLTNFCSTTGVRVSKIFFCYLWLIWFTNAQCGIEGRWALAAQDLQVRLTFEELSVVARQADKLINQGAVLPFKISRKEFLDNKLASDTIKQHSFIIAAADSAEEKFKIGVMARGKFYTRQQGLSGKIAIIKEGVIDYDQSFVAKQILWYEGAKVVDSLIYIGSVAIETRGDEPEDIDCPLFGRTLQQRRKTTVTPWIGKQLVGAKYYFGSNQLMLPLLSQTQSVSLLPVDQRESGSLDSTSEQTTLLVPQTFIDMGVVAGQEPADGGDRNNCHIRNNKKLNTIFFQSSSGYFWKHVGA